MVKIVVGETGVGDSQTVERESHVGSVIAVIVIGAIAVGGIWAAQAHPEWFGGLFGTGVATGNSTISGSVRSKGGTALVGAVVAIKGKSAAVDTTGRYTLDKILGGETYTVTAVAAGYVTSSQDVSLIYDGETKTVDFELEREPAVATWVDLHRFYGGGGNTHFYTTDKTEGDILELTYEGTEGKVSDPAKPVPAGMVVLNRFCGFLGDRFYSVQASSSPPAGYFFEKFAGVVFPPNISPVPSGAVPLYKYYRNIPPDHFYTLVGKSYPPYAYEGIACYVMP